MSDTTRFILSLGSLRTCFSPPWACMSNCGVASPYCLTHLLGDVQNLPSGPRYQACCYLAPEERDLTGLTEVLISSRLRHTCPVLKWDPLLLGGDGTLHEHGRTW
eukprot:1349793-Rhodomonas_salina.5